MTAFLQDFSKQSCMLDTCIMKYKYLSSETFPGGAEWEGGNAAERPQRNEINVVL